ncbi:hypothetical protein NL676_038227 [Syzygium grande]|nr:hypothetical protein NL676_038227 [Syzygium grande]
MRQGKTTLHASLLLKERKNHPSSSIHIAILHHHPESLFSSLPFRHSCRRTANGCPWQHHQRRPCGRTATAPLKREDQTNGQSPSAALARLVELSEQRRNRDLEHSRALSTATRNGKRAVPEAQRALIEAKEA